MFTLNIRKSLLLLISMVIVALLMTGCSGNAGSTGNTNNEVNPESQKREEEKTYKFAIATGGTSGTFYYIGAGIAEVVRKHLPNVEIEVQSTSASIENARLVARGMVDFGLSTTEASYDANNALDEFKDEEKGNIYAIRNSHIAFRQMVTLDPKIKTPYDLKGKRVTFGAPGSVGHLTTGPQFMEAHGMTYDDVDEQALAYGEAIEAMKDGNLDVASVGAGAPTAALVDLFSARPDAHFISIGDSELEKMMELDPYIVKAVIPANTYSGQTEPISTTGLAQVLIVNKNIPEDIVYQIVKVLEEHKDEMIPIHAAFKEWTNESVDMGIKVPYHPGAEKYYKEIGVLK